MSTAFRPLVGILYLISIPIVLHINYSLEGNPLSVFDIFLHFSSICLLIISPSIAAFNFFKPISIENDLDFLDQFILGLPILLSAILLMAVIGHFGGLLFTKFLIFSMVFMALTYLVRTRNFGSIPKINLKFLGLLTIVIILHWFLYFYKFNFPNAPGDKMPIYTDLLWNTSNIWSVIRYVSGDSVTSSGFYGLPLPYHIMQSIFEAFLSITTGIAPFKILMILNPPYLIILTCLTLRTTSRHFLNCMPEVLIVAIFLATALSFKTGGYTGHLYYNPLTFLFSLPLFIIGTSYLLTEKRFNIYYLFTVYFALFMSKSSSLVTFPLAVLPKELRDRRKNEYLKIGAISLLGMILAYITAKYFLLGGGSRIGSIVVRKEHETLLLFAPRYMRAYIFYFLENATHLLYLPFIFPLILSLFYYLKLKTVPSFKAMITIFLVIMHIALNSVMRFKGASVYFYWYSNIAIILYLGTAYFNDLKSNMWFKRTCEITLAIQIIFFPYALKQWRLDNLYWSDNYLKDKHVDVRSFYSYEEQQAFTWISENREKYDVIVSNRATFPVFKDGSVQHRFFLYSAFAGIPVYAEGYDYLFGESRDIALRRREEIKDFFTEGKRITSLARKRILIFLDKSENEIPLLVDYGTKAKVLFSEGNISLLELRNVN
jgi:hypothetical protein